MATKPLDINTNSKCGIVCGSPTHDAFTLPSPLPTKRVRTLSQTERAANAEISHGRISSFCREKGHGFVIEDGTGQDLFIHISDIDGEYVPCPGDVVVFKKMKLPPKFEKYQAVHLSITHLSPGVKHTTWTGDRSVFGDDFSEEEPNA